MAITDLFVLALCPGLFLFHEMFQSYKLGPIGCKAEGMLEVSLLITSVITLCFISYDRLTAIAFPLENRLNFHSAKIAICVSWLGGFVLSAPLAIFRNYQERQWKNFLESFCTENLQVLPIYWHVLIVALVWIPLAFLVFCYSCIFWKLDQYEKIRRKHDNPLTISYKRKFAVTLFIVVLTFALLRLPFTTLVFIRSNMLKHSEMNQIEGSFQVLWYISHYLIFVDCTLTPIIYGVTNENFRRAFRSSKCYKYFCWCSKPSVPTIAVEIFTFGNRNAYKLEPRTPIVAKRRNYLTPGWLVPERSLKISSKKSAVSECNVEKFQTTDYI